MQLDHKFEYQTGRTIHLRRLEIDFVGKKLEW